MIWTLGHNRFSDALARFSYFCQRCCLHTCIVRVQKGKMAALKEIAIQDLYAEPYRHCFGCGPDNEQGWHIKSYWHGAEVLAHYTPRPEYTGGVPENLYGGLLAAILDCHGTAAAAAFYHIAQGFQLGVEPLLRCVTASLTVNYRKPTPMGQELELFARCTNIEGRKVSLELGVRIGDVQYCDGSMLAVRVKE